MKTDEYKKSFIKMLKSNALYFALGLVFLAAGVVGFSSAGNKTPTGTEITTKKVETPVRNEKTSETDNFQIKINIDEFTTLPNEEPSTAAVFDNNATEISEETTANEPVNFSSPLSLNIGSDFSMGVPVFSQTMNDYRTHNGVDFIGVKGESVRTVGEGTVVSVEKNALWGNQVTVDHGNGITSCISGLSDEALIGVGTTVYTDTVIGVIGDIPVEKSEQSHIHLEMRENGKLVDPLELLGLTGEE